MPVDASELRPYSGSAVRLLLTIAVWFVCSWAAAQEVVPPEDEAIILREPGSELRWAPPPAPGTCIGGSCAPGTTPPTMIVPPAGPRDVPHDRRERFAYTGAVLGGASAALVLGGAIAIATVNDVNSERITRGVWLGYFALSTPLVALSAYLARKQYGGDSGAGQATRNIGWIAYSLAMADGVLLWVGAFKRFGNTDVLTIGAGAIGACALVPHALDAFVAARGITSRRFTRLEPMANGLRVRF